jgi:hypothetical protein
MLVVCSGFGYAAATLYPLRAPPIPWHTIGLDYLTHLLESNGFNNVLIVVDHLTRMAYFSAVYRDCYRRRNRYFVFIWSLPITWTIPCAGQ